MKLFAVHFGVLGLCCDTFQSCFPVTQSRHLYTLLEKVLLVLGKFL